MLTPTKHLEAGWLHPVELSDEAVTRAVLLLPNLNLKRGTILAESQVAGADEVQTLTIGGTPNGGYVRLAYALASTPGLHFSPRIDWSAVGATLAANIQAALDTLFGFDADEDPQVVVAGTGPFTLTFSGPEVAGRAIALPTIMNSLTGAAPTVAIETTTPGSAGLVGVFGEYNDGASNGLEVAKGIAAHHVITNALGQPVDEWGVNTQSPTAAMWVGGDFLCSELHGLDAAAVADLGKILSGETISTPGAIVRIGV